MASERRAASVIGDLRPSFPCTGDDLVAARACEQVVFGRRFGNTADELASEYGPFEACTAFGAVLAADGRAMGAVRLVRPGPRRLKTLSDAGRPPWNVPDHVIDGVVNRPTLLGEPMTWDVASFGVDSHAAGADRRTTMALLSVMFGAFRDNAVTSFVAILDLRARRALHMLGVRMLDLPGASPAPYLGSPSSVPVYRQVTDLHSEHARSFPRVHRQLFHGQGINGLDACHSAPGAFAVPAAG